MLTDFRKVKDDYDTPAEIIIQKIWSYGENLQSIQNVRTLAEVGLFSLTDYRNSDKLLAQLLFCNSKISFASASHIAENNVDYVNSWKINNRKKAPRA